MSIDARVDSVHINEDGSGELRLVDRPARPGGLPGIAGRPSLSFEKAPEEVTALNGRDIWGSSSCVMLGEREIARRLGYTKILFVPDAEFKAALSATPVPI